MAIDVGPKVILRFETNLADENMSSQAEDNIIIPSNISAASFIQAAADNNDFQEEPLDGKPMQPQWHCIKDRQKMWCPG